VQPSEQAQVVTVALERAGIGWVLFRHHGLPEKGTESTAKSTAREKVFCRLLPTIHEYNRIFPRRKSIFPGRR
jgi:hypothetical protein